MSNNSNIEWCEATWNCVVGCTPVSPGCLNCYAATMARRLEGMGRPEYVGLTINRGLVVGDRKHAGDDEVCKVTQRTRTMFNGTVRCLPGKLDIPLRRRKPTVWFVNSMSDLFHEAVPFDFIDRVFAVMALTPRHTFQVLTKRPERMAEYLGDAGVSHRVAKAMDSIAVANEIAEMKEQWRPVGGRPDYSVSNTGVVKGPRGVLLPEAGEQGHSRVALYGGERTRVLVHRLVYSTFVRQLADHEQIRHRNGDPTCNALPNLLVGSQAENWKDAKRHGSHRRYSKLSPEDVATIRIRANDGVSSEQLARDAGVSATQIRNIIRGDQWATVSGIEWPIPRLWLGTSVEDQARADERIPHLLRCPAAVRFLSVEPMLGPVDLYTTCMNKGGWTGDPAYQYPANAGVDWVIVGGESGANARPFDVAWARSIRDQCKAAGVPFFMKQITTRGRKMPFQEWPDDMQIREFPVRAAGGAS